MSQDQVGKKKDKIEEGVRGYARWEVRQSGKGSGIATTTRTAGPGVWLQEQAAAGRKTQYEEHGLSGCKVEISYQDMQRFSSEQVDPRRPLKPWAYQYAALTVILSASAAERRMEPPRDLLCTMYREGGGPYYVVDIMRFQGTTQPLSGIIRTVAGGYSPHLSSSYP